MVGLCLSLNPKSGPRVLKSAMSGKVGFAGGFGFASMGLREDTGFYIPWLWKVSEEESNAAFGLSRRGSYGPYIRKS